MTDSNHGGLQEFTTDYEQQLGLPDGFIIDLLVERDDWSFVIKLHGLLEGAVTKKLLELLGRPALAKPFRYVNMRTMIAMAESVEAISTRTETFLLALGQLRNACVHTVANVGLDLDRWAADATNANVKNPLIGPDGAAGFAVAPPFNPYRFVLWGQALTAMAELHGATVAQSEVLSGLIDAEIELRGQRNAAAVRAAVMRRLSEGSESSDTE
jgi:hypothetical protein